MAVSTNLGLYLPTREDYISVSRDLSNNYEVIDEHAGMMEKGSAIVIDGDTAPQAITSGQFLLIKNHTTLTSGSYHATTNIANGATISNSNVAIDSNGLSNALKGEIDTLNSKTTATLTSSKLATNTPERISLVKRNGVCFLLIAGYTTEAVAKDNGLFWIPSAYRPPQEVQFIGRDANNNMLCFYTGNDGGVNISNVDLPQNKWIFASACWVV